MKQLRKLCVLRNLFILVHLCAWDGKMLNLTLNITYVSLICNLYIMKSQLKWIEIHLCEAQAQFLCDGLGAVWVCHLCDPLHFIAIGSILLLHVYVSECKILEFCCPHL